MAFEDVVAKFDRFTARNLGSAQRTQSSRRWQHSTKWPTSTISPACSRGRQVEDSEPIERLAPNGYGHRAKDLWDLALAERLPRSSVFSLLRISASSQLWSRHRQAPKSSL